MRHLSNTVQTAYSTLLQKARDSRFARLSAVGFTKKTLRDKVYWYCQYTDISGARKQRYFGQDSEELRRRMDEIAGEQDGYSTILAERKRLVSMIIAGGGPSERGRPAKILEKLSDAGVFDAGGVLIGSFAYSCYGPLLGVVFDEQMRKTEDMDVACDRSIEIGVAHDLKGEIASAAPDMAKPRQINPWVPPYEMIAPDGFKIEFLTTKESPSERAPIRIDSLGINAQPLDFMDYLVRDPVQAVVLYSAGIIVNVPDPGRFALHKLAVSQLRPAGLSEKRRKDIAQAESLIEALMDQNPGALILAADEMNPRTDKLADFVIAGTRYMANRDLAKGLLAECFGRGWPQ